MSVLYFRFFFLSDVGASVASDFFVGVFEGVGAAGSCFILTSSSSSDEAPIPLGLRAEPLVVPKGWYLAFRLGG